MGLFEFADRAVLAHTLAGRIAGRLDALIEQGHDPVLAVSGGSTPQTVFKLLSATELDWSRVTLTLTDERFVPPSSPRSNMAMVTRLLLQDKAAAAQFVPLYSGETVAPEEAARQAEAALAGMQLDICMLGMGVDGHTASLFPEGDNLSLALTAGCERRVAAMNAPGANEPRLTLTLSALLEAQTLTLHIEGEEKRAAYERASAPGPVEEMPVRAVLRAASNRIDVYWAP